MTLGQEVQPHPASLSRLRELLARIAAEVHAAVPCRALGLVFRDHSRPGMMQRAFQLGDPATSLSPALLIGETRDFGLYDQPGFRVFSEESASPYPLISELLRMTGAATMFSVPLHWHGNMIGRLVVCGDGEITYSLDEAAAVAALEPRFAEHAATIIAGFHASHEHQPNHWESLLELNNQLLASRRFEEYGPLVARFVHDVLPHADFCSLGLRHSGDSTVHIRIYPAPGPQMEAGTRRVELSESHHGWVIEHGAPLFLDDIRQGPALGREAAETCGSLGVASACYLPLRAKEECFGAIGVLSRRPAAFREVDLSWLLRTAEQLAISIRNGLAYEELRASRQRIQHEKRYLEEERDLGEPSLEDIVIADDAFGHTIEQTRIVAATNATVLILGETGTGKELIARAIHRLSRRSGRTLVKLNCAAIPTGLLESELFGHEKGAFTGAHATKPGRFELAQHGTLFLDEIAELDLPLQAKLLHFLQDGRFARIGAEDERHVETRVVTATNRPVSELVASGALRQDLLYRIGVVTLNLPPLRERAEDLPALVEYFLMRYGGSLSASALRRPLSATAMAALRNYSWPGNIRELENLIQRYLILGDETALLAGLTGAAPVYALQDLPLDGSLPLKVVTQRAIKEIERRVILAVLQQHRWNRKKTASVLDISYRALLYKIRELGVPSRRRTPALRLRAAAPNPP